MIGNMRNLQSCCGITKSSSGWTWLGFVIRKVIKEEHVMLGKVFHALDVGGQWRDDKWMMRRVARGWMGEVKWGERDEQLNYKWNI